MDVGEHPCLNTKLNGTGNDGSHDLAEEHGARRNLHVVAKLHVGGESQRLSHGDITEGLEQHLRRGRISIECLEVHAGPLTYHGQGLAGQPVTNDQFGNDVQTDLLVSDGLNHADGDRVHEGYGERKVSKPNIGRPD